MTSAQICGVQRDTRQIEQNVVDDNPSFLHDLLGFSYTFHYWNPDIELIIAFLVDLVR